MTEIEHDGAATPGVTMANVLYVMHGLSPFTLWTLSLVAVIIGAVYRGNVRGTWVDTHFSYLARTYFWGLLWFLLTTFVFVISIVGWFLLFIPWGILTLWYLYRVIRGWLRLNDRLPAP